MKNTLLFLVLIAIAGCGGDGDDTSANTETGSESSNGETSADVVTDTGNTDPEEDTAQPDEDVAEGLVVPSKDGIVELARVETGTKLYDIAVTGPGIAMACSAEGLFMVHSDGIVGNAVSLGAPCKRVSVHLAVDTNGGVHALELGGEDGVSITDSIEDAGVNAAIRVGEKIYGVTNTNLVEIDLEADSVSNLADIGGYDLAVDPEEAVLVIATHEGVSSFVIADASTFSVEMNHGAQRIQAIDGPSFLAAGMYESGHLVVDLDGTITPASTFQVRGTALDVAPLGDCAIIAAWDNMVRMGCDGELTAKEYEEVRRDPHDKPPVSHIHAIDSSIDDQVVAISIEDVLFFDAQEEADAADISTGNLRLKFAGVVPNETASVGVTLKNDGNQPLVVYSVEIEDPAFEVHIDADFAGDTGAYAGDPVLAIEPSYIPAFFEVRVTTDNVEPITTQMLVTSNDPDEPVFSIAVTLNAPNLAVDALLPDISLSDTDGNIANLSDWDGDVIYLKLFNGL